MTKTKLETFMKKYFLGGLHDEIRWTSKDGVLTVSEMTSDKKLMTYVEMSKFDAFKDVEFVIKDTSKLKAMISPLSENITIELVSGDDDVNRIVQMYIADETLKSEYQTGDSEHLPPKPKVNNIPSYDVEVKLTEEFVGRFMKSKAALSDVNLFTLIMSKKKNKLEMVLGYSSNNNTDRIVLGLDTVEGKDTLKAPINFSANVLKEILAANSEVKDAVLKVSEQGLAYLEFINDDFKARYYMIKIPVED
jgi:hypothetical protein